MRWGLFGSSSQKMVDVSSQSPSSGRGHIQNWLCSLFDLHDFNLAPLRTQCHHSCVCVCVCSVWHMLHPVRISGSVTEHCVCLSECVFVCVSVFACRGCRVRFGGWERHRAAEAVLAWTSISLWTVVALSEREAGGVNSPGSSRHLSPLAGPLWQRERDQVSALVQRALMPECSEMSDLERTPSA